MISCRPQGFVWNYPEPQPQPGVGGVGLEPLQGDRAPEPKVLCLSSLGLHLPGTAPFVVLSCPLLSQAPSRRGYRPYAAPSPEMFPTSPSTGMQLVAPGEMLPHFRSGSSPSTDRGWACGHRVCGHPGEVRCPPPPGSAQSPSCSCLTTRDLDSMLRPAATESKACSP